MLELVILDVITACKKRYIFNADHKINTNSIIIATET